MATESDKKCCLCQVSGEKRSLVGAASLRSALVADIAATHPGKWQTSGAICTDCLRTARVEHSIRQLELERGQLSEVERDVAARAAGHEHVVEELEKSMWTGGTMGERAADKIASVGGSWPFVIVFIGVMVVWTVANAVFLGREAFDPYPFILLNLVLSCLAALQAPIIIMSQNRSAIRDRAQAGQDFRVNLKAEMELVTLHEKMDHLLHVQWERMVELQQTQLDILNDLVADKPSQP